MNIENRYKISFISAKHIILENVPFGSTTLPYSFDSSISIRTEVSSSSLQPQLVETEMVTEPPNVVETSVPLQSSISNNIEIPDTSIPPPSFTPSIRPMQPKIPNHIDTSVPPPPLLPHNIRFPYMTPNTLISPDFEPQAFAPNIPNNNNRFFHIDTSVPPPSYIPPQRYMIQDIYMRPNRYMHPPPFFRPSFGMPKPYYMPPRPPRFHRPPHHVRLRFNLNTQPIANNSFISNHPYMMHRPPTSITQGQYPVYNNQNRFISNTNFQNQRVKEFNPSHNTNINTSNTSVLRTPISSTNTSSTSVSQLQTTNKKQPINTSTCNDNIENVNNSTKEPIRHPNRELSNNTSLLHGNPQSETPSTRPSNLKTNTNENILSDFQLVRNFENSKLFSVPEGYSRR